MSKSKMTPGPWTLAQFSTGAEVYAQLRGHTQMVAAVVSVRHNDPEGNANAAAITALPDLIEALHGVMERANKEYRILTDGEHGTLDDFPEFIAALAALKKAGCLAD